MQALFAKTVGPVHEAFVIYNSQGLSKGMAVVSFHRPGDAAIARQKYNGKIIDGSEYPWALHVDCYIRTGSYGLALPRQDAL